MLVGCVARFFLFIVILSFCLSLFGMLHWNGYRYRPVYLENHLPYSFRRHQDLPLRVYNQYKAWHNADALRNDPHPTTSRKFSIISYFCPQQAGNRLHDFMNGLLWSIVTNRTALFKYLDNETCLLQQANMALDPGLCQYAGTEADCQQVLKRNPWIPTWNEFAPPLHLVDEMVYTPSPYTVFYPEFLPAYYLQAGHEYNETIQQSLPKMDTLPQTLVAFPQALEPSRSLGSKPARQYLFATSWSHTMARQLQRLGLRFLYGMILNDTLSFGRPVWEGVATVELVNPSTVYSIAVHSRHQHMRDDGRNVSREVECIKRLLAEQNSERCRIFIMSDRPATLDKLQMWIQRRGCLTVTAFHSEANATTGINVEHGPNSGVGYLRDLLTVSQARDAFVATSSTSSALVRERIMFLRYQEEKELGIQYRPFAFCHLPVSGQ